MWVIRAAFVYKEQVPGFYLEYHRRKDKKERERKKKIGKKKKKERKREEGRKDRRRKWRMKEREVSEILLLNQYHQLSFHHSYQYILTL